MLSPPFWIFLVLIFLPQFNQALRTNCIEADDFKERKECYETGKTVTFVAGGYYFCCHNLTHEQLMSIGASAFWTREIGFCGRGACEVCSKKQECVVFSDDDIFCCPRGYSKYQLKLEHEKEMAKEMGHKSDEDEINTKKRKDKKESKEGLEMKREKEVEDDDLLEET